MWKPARFSSVATAILLLGTLAPAVQNTPARAAPTAAEGIAQATTTLQALERSAIIPVTVLNHARCLLIVKQLRPAPAQNSAVGACYSGSEWSEPAFYRVSVEKVSSPPHATRTAPEQRSLTPARLAPEGEASTASDAIVLVLDEAAADQMAAGAVHLAPSAAGPLASETPLLPPVELRGRTAVTYSASGNVVSGVALGAAAVERDDAATAALRDELAPSPA